MNNYSISVGVIATNESNEILLIKGPIRGWEFPGGIVEPSESIWNSAIREVLEETGYTIKPLEINCIYQNLTKNVISFIMRAFVVSGEARTSKESLEVGFFTREEAIKMINYSNFVDRLNNCLDNKKGLDFEKIISFHE
ncbi:MAG: NUDIX hydrolase [Bacteroidales bacterium]|nr:NUDIX hydrolase [Bacteroidales bacterium]